MRAYLDLLDRCIHHGVDQPTRNAVRRTIFVHNLAFDLSAGFPMVTTRYVPPKNFIHEMIWFLNGETNTRYLRDNNVHIWDANADPDGNVGPIYGYQWRNFGGLGFDQIVKSIALLRGRLHTTRVTVTAMNPAQQDAMKLPPCHVFFQLYKEGDYLSLSAQMRSTDVCLGLPTNIAGYAMLLHCYCKLLDLRPAMLYMGLGDTHVYANHIEKAKVQLERTPLPLPSFTVREVTPDLRNLAANAMILEGYQCHNPIYFKLSA